MITLVDRDPLLGIEADSTDTPRLKLVPGARYRAKVGWTVPATPATVFVLHSLFQPDEILNTANRLLDTVSDEHRLLMAIRAGTFDDFGVGLDGLYPFQEIGVNFLRTARRVLLADEMGCGKTVQVLRALQSGPALVVCPNSVKYNWAREAAVWAPERTPVVVDGSASRRRKLIDEAFNLADPLVIINYESLKLHTKWVSPTNVSVPAGRRQVGELNHFPWSTVVLDEAHRIKNPKAQQTMACHGVADGVQYRYALTGTPILNDESDLWPLLKWVDPGQYPDKSRFHKRYLLEQPGFFGGWEVRGLNPAHEREFHQILETTMLRRTKAEVLPQLPPKMVTTLDTPLVGKQAKAYADFYRDLVLRLENGGVIAGRSIGEELARLRQLACGTPEVDENNEVVGLTTPSSKLDEVLDLLDAIGTDQLVIYTEHRLFLELLVRELRDRDIATGMVAGGVSASERQRVIDAFAAGDIRVFAATTAAAAEGINLTSSARLVFAQLPWSQGHYLQAQDRVHRPGAEVHEHVEIIRMVTPDTIEQAVLNALTDKALRLENVTQDSQRLLALLKGIHGT